MSCSLIEIIRGRKDRSGTHRQPGTESDPQAYSRHNPSDPRPAYKVPASVSHPGFLQPTFPDESASNNLRAFAISELKSATKGFAVNNQLGEGGFGLVYKGTIKHKTSRFSDSEEKLDVAIKQLNTSGLQGHHEWVTEVHFLGMVDNPYLVKLIGYCADDDERGILRLLVYEYMANKGLDDHLFRTAGPGLSWQTRIKIAIGAATGLAYLHDDKEIIFRDLKAANILLDKEFNPKLSDFGLARQGPDADKTHVSTGVKGTYGYAAPEYIQTGHLTFKSDVFSFGMVLLEILTGRKAMDRNRPRTEQHLLEWVKPFIKDQRKFHLAVDPKLKGQYPIKAAMKFATIAIQCLVKQPKARPKMKDIVEALKKVSDLTHQWELGSTTSAPQAAINTIASSESHTGSPRHGLNPKPLPLPPSERPSAPATMMSSEGDGLQPRGARRPPARDPPPFPAQEGINPGMNLGMIQGINQWYHPSTGERNAEPERKSIRTGGAEARSNFVRNGNEDRYRGSA